LSGGDIPDVMAPGVLKGTDECYDCNGCEEELYIEGLVVCFSLFFVSILAHGNNYTQLKKK
jgi:hypothetical protein